MAQYLGMVQLGGFYNNGTILKRPTKPWVPSNPNFPGDYTPGVGDIPKMSGSIESYTFGDTPASEANRLQWHKIKDGDKTLFICDRVILATVSWDDLNAQGYITGKTVTIDGTTYKCRVPTGGSDSRLAGSAGEYGGAPVGNEWDRFIVNEDAIAGLPVPSSYDLDGTLMEADKTSAHNQFWHWFCISSWAAETYSADSNLRVIRGEYSAKRWNTRASTARLLEDGFRPVLEVVNTAPTTPTDITVPAQINGGSTITLSWGASTDAEANLEGYKVERSVDGGTTWMQIYQGGAASTTNIVPFGTESVMYRVKAYDTEGLESGWKTSGQVTVINNTAPTVPGSITVPEAVQGGQPLPVVWGASSDGENNLAGYSLERQVDGGEWAEVYKGAALTFTDAITRGWASVNYRVRAYDTYNIYGPYTTGISKPVDNNRAPVITSDTASGTDLGTKTADFSITYTVADQDTEDTLTVTEAVDGVTLRTFTATAGTENTLAMTGETFMKLLNGPHTLTITATDGKVNAVHTLTFTKEVTEATITLETPMEADAKITICVLSVSGDIPADAEYKVEVTNNGNDDAPVWEDCTMEVKNGGNHIFANETAENGFAFNFRVSVKRGESGKGGYINSVQGGFQ